jgi:hypothetical protein
MGLDYTERRPGPQTEDSQPQEDSVEVMHKGARAEVDDFPAGPREEDSPRGPQLSDRPVADPGGTAGEHSGQKKSRPASSRQG